MLDFFAAWTGLLWHSQASQVPHAFDMADNALALILALAWGLGSCLLSPCHLAAIPVMAAQIAHQEHKGAQPSPVAACASFGLGYFLAMLTLGTAGALLGLATEGGEQSHWWFVPAGMVLMLSGFVLWRQHQCGPSAHGGGLVSSLAGLARRHAEAPPAATEAPTHKGALPVLQGRGRHVGGGIMLGALYGLLSGTCSLAFLAPVLVLGLTQGAGTAMAMAAAFALGHSLPLMLAGFAAPLARKALQRCHPHHHGEHKHHNAEVLFRKVTAASLFVAGCLFMLHPLWH